MKSNNKIVLIGVVNRKKDLTIALQKRWYRIPISSALKRKAGYLALYQTHVFGPEGKKISYYAPIKKYTTTIRKKLLPDEKQHPRANNKYLKLSLGRIRQTPRPIRNKTRRRINFGFTTLKQLQQAREISQLFDIAPLEDILAKTMKKKGITALPQHCIMHQGRCRYRLDFAVFHPRGKIAIECDAEKWHGQPQQQKKDRIRDRWLKRQGWQIMRFPGEIIRQAPNSCSKEIKRYINKLN